MLYDKESDDYYDEFEEILDSYADNGAMFLDVPDVVFETKPVQVHLKHATRCAETIINYMDADMPELADEEAEYFSNILPDHAKGELVTLIHTWIQKHASTVEPDFTKPVEFKKAYEEFIIPKLAEKWFQDARSDRDADWEAV